MDVLCLIQNINSYLSFKKVVEPVLSKGAGSIYYINLSKDKLKLGGSAFAQILNKIGNDVPTITDAAYFKKAFNTIQDLINDNQIAAGHDVGSGGLITTLLEMCFAGYNLDADIDLTGLNEPDMIKALFNENIAVVLQAQNDVAFENKMSLNGIEFVKIGVPSEGHDLKVFFGKELYVFNINELRDTWFITSYYLDKKQSKNGMARERLMNYKNQPLRFNFPFHFNGAKPVIDPTVAKPKAAIIREKGSNSEREMANAMFLAGFDVKDVHMTDLISGRETLEDIQFGKRLGWCIYVQRKGKYGIKEFLCSS